MHLSAAESAAVVADLRRARRKQRVAAIHWVDALYQVYVTGLLAIVAIIGLSSLVGDGQVAPSTVLDVAEYGPAAMGLIVSVSIFVGLRSGSRGGPLALERPDVRHVLLSPVDRGVALRGPAWRQLRFLIAVGAAVGAVAGQLAVRRLPGNAIFWVAMGALFGVVVVALGFGCALCASGTVLPGWAATFLGGLLIAWSVGDLTGHLPMSPTSFVGELPLWPLELPPDGSHNLDPVGLIGIVLGAVLVFAGMRLIAGSSLEAAERRTALVGQLRFAVTLQDLRTVLVLRRQLAQERPLARPWIPAMRRAPRFVVWHRGVRSLARWPLSRLIRLALMAAVTGLSLRAVWDGTTPLVIVAGLAMWIVALDAAEPLGQEVDHPGRTDAFPVPRGELLLKHLPIAIAISMAAGLLAAVVAAAPIGDGVPWGPAIITGLTAGLLAACGAAVSVVQGAPGPVDTLGMMTPEIAGMRTVYRTAWPPAMAVLGTLPLLAARASVEGIEEPPPVPAAINVAIILTGVAVLTGGWVRFRDDIHRAIADAAEAASPSKQLERQRQERIEAEEREAEALRESKRLAGLDPDAPDAPPKPKPRPPKPKTSKPLPPPPEGVRGGTSAKPIGRRRDQK